MPSLGRDSNGEDNHNIEAISDEEIAVLESIPTTATKKSIQYSLNFSSPTNRSISVDDIETEMILEDIDAHLTDLEARELIKYLGHGEWKLTTQGRGLLYDTSESTTVEDPHPENITSNSIIHPDSSIWNLALCFLLVGVCVYQVGQLFATPVNLNRVNAPLLILATLAPVLLLITILHTLQYGILWTGFAISRFITIEDGHTSFDDREKKKADKEQKTDIAIRSMANSFRFWIFLIVPIALMLTSAIDFHSNISNQAYGLVLDASGGIFLALEVLRTDRLGSAGVDLATTDSGDETKTTTDGMWGAFFLVFGFFLQFLSLLPWKAVLSLFGY